MNPRFANRPEISSLGFEHMVFRYENDRPIFDDVSFDLPVGNFVWLRAHEVGSGRSTLLQILAGLLPVSAGKYMINDKNVAEMSFEEFLPYRLSMGYAFDYGGLLHNKTLFENMMLPLQYHKLCSMEEAEERVRFYMQEMGIYRYRDQRPSAVQGSVRKIAILVRPLLIKPQMLLLDNPSAGLAQEQILVYLDLVQGLRRQNLARHVFISSLDEKLMGLVDHQELFIDQGQLYTTDVSATKRVVNI